MERAAKTMKLIPISQYLYDQVMEEIMSKKYVISLSGEQKLEPLYTPEQKYQILRYLINFLESKQGEIAKEIN